MNKRDREYYGAFVAAVALEVELAAVERAFPASQARPVGVSKHKMIAASWIAEELMTIHRSLHRIAERQCNGYPKGYGANQTWDEEAEKKDERREERLEQRAAKIANEAGLTIETQGDPRGPVLSVVIDGRTWGVPR